VHAVRSDYGNGNGVLDHMPVGGDAAEPSDQKPDPIAVERRPDPLAAACARSSFGFSALALGGQTIS